MPTPALRPPIVAPLVPLVVTSLLLASPLRLLAVEPPGAGAAGPAGSPAVALLVVPAPDVAPAAAAALRGRLAARLAADGRIVTAGREPSPPDGATLEALRRALEAGRAAYEALDPAAARTRFEAITAALEADSRLLEAAPDLHDAPVYLGLVALGLGDRAGASRAFERAIRLDPTRPLPPGRFAPAAEDAYALARIRLAAVAPALLRIDATPAATDLFVDGVYRGRTPLAVERLQPGRHLLLAQAPGVGIATRRVVATRFGPALLELAVPAGPASPSLVALAAGLDAGSPPAPLPPAAARGLARALGADRLLLVRVEGALAGFRAAAGIVDLGSGLWSAHGPAGEASEAAALGERVAAWLATASRPAAVAGAPALLPDWRRAGAPGAAGGTAAGGLAIDPLAARPAEEAPPSAAEEPGRPWYRRWYVWLLLGAGVAIGVAAAAQDGGGGGNGTGSVSVGPQP